MDIAKKYEALINACKNDTELLDFIAERLAKMPEYVNKRVQHIIYSYTHSGRVLNDDNVLNKLCELDRLRTNAHETAICACQQLNRISQSMNLPLFFEGDLNDREQVACFASEVTIIFFDNNKMYSRTKPKDLLDDMVSDNYYIDIKDKSIERLCRNSKTSIDYENKDISNCEEEYDYDDR